MNTSVDLVTITLPDALKLKLDTLNINLTPSLSEIYLDFDHDLPLNLEQIFNLHSPVPSIEMALDLMISQIFGSKEIIISNPQYRIYQNLPEVEISFQGLLNHENIEIIFGKRTILKYKLPKDFAFKKFANILPILKNLKLINPELIITDIGHSITHSQLGCIKLTKGVNLIGDIDLKNLPTNFSGFIHENLGISRCGTMISFNPAGQVGLTSNIAGDIQLFSQHQFTATLNNLLIELNINNNLEPNIGLTGNLILQGYDLTQDNEPPLLLGGNLSLEPESLTAYFYQQSERSWCNPYGLVGTEFRNIRFQGGGTYLPPYFDNFGFLGDLKWDQIDIEVAFLMDTNDPERIALILTPNQAVSLIDLWNFITSSFVNKQVDYSTNLVNKALNFLETFFNLNIEPVDADGDEKFNPLIKYVPFPTKIAGQTISEGLEINGKINAWGEEAILILQGDKTFKNIGGSLKVPEIDLGLIKITGADDDSLDLCLKVTPNEQYFQGDGYVEILGNEIANVEFLITSTTAIFKNFDLSLGNLLKIDVDDISIDIKSGTGSGSGKILVLGNTLAGVTFDITENSVNLKNVHLGLVGFLTFSVPSLTVNLVNKSAAGTGNIIAFNQTLGSGTLSFNEQNIAINNVVLNLVNILKLNIPSFQLDVTNKKLFGVGDIILLGKQFTALGISLNESGFQATSNFNFGILAFNCATVTLGKGINGNLNNSASIAGNLKFLGYTFANITANVDSNKLTASGRFNFGGILLLKGIKNQKNAAITLQRSQKGRYNSVSITGRFYLLNQELTALNIQHNHGNIKIFGISISVKK